MASAVVIGAKAARARLIKSRTLAPLIGKTQKRNVRANEPLEIPADHPLGAADDQLADHDG